MNDFNLQGKRFGRLVVVKVLADDSMKSFCRCDCGTGLDISTKFLLNGYVKSCGCVVKELFYGNKGAFYGLFNSYVSDARSEGMKFSIAPEEFFNVVTKRCAYCGVEPLNTHSYGLDQFVHNYLDRVDNSRGYELDNVVSCCSTCKTAKGSMTQEQFLKWVKRAYTTQYHKVTNSTPGQLIDLLFTTDYKCWWAQEDIYKYKDVDPEKSALAAYKAQELNAKRTKLIRTIDSILGFAEDTNTEKTYSSSDVNEQENYTYFRENHSG